MHNERPHPYLAQIPLTVSPFISLPTATTLPYTYKTVPSKLPSSSTADLNGAEPEKYIVSPSGHKAHPDEIIASCQALQAHLQIVQEDSKQTLRDWEASLREQELAEKRRLAPGWLDREEKLLEPERPTSTSGTPGRADVQSSSNNIKSSHDSDFHSEKSGQGPQDHIGDEIDRAFGGLTFQRG